MDQTLAQGREDWSVLNTFMKRTSPPVVDNSEQLEAQRKAAALVRQMNVEVGQARHMLRQLASYMREIERLAPLMSEHAAQEVSSRKDSCVEQIVSCLGMFTTEGGKA